jgi:hypothetical protein
VSNHQEAHVSRSSVLLLLLLAGACATVQEDSEDREVRSASDTPPSFATEDGVAPVQGCNTTVIDPRDQTRLRLIRSAVIGGAYRGDYDVPDGKYGVRRDELLRVDCATGEVVGIVRGGS